MPPAPSVTKSDEPPASAARERFDRIYHTLRDRISLLDYPPGSRLSEEALATEFGMSRTPLRRVLGLLEAQGLLVSVQGVGTIVTDADIDALAQVYELRMELAEMFGRLSPVTHSQAPVAEMRALRERSRALVARPDPRAFARLNIDFFHTLARCTDNAPLREIDERLYYQTTRIWLKSISHLDLAEEVATFGEEVDEICKAVELGDISAVGHIRRAHISMSFHRLRLSKGRAGP